MEGVIPSGHALPIVAESLISIDSAKGEACGSFFKSTELEPEWCKDAVWLIRCGCAELQTAGVLFQLPANPGATSSEAWTLGGYSVVITP